MLYWVFMFESFSCQYLELLSEITMALFYNQVRFKMSNKIVMGHLFKSVASSSHPI